MSSRKDELLAKKARLAELKRQRELRQGQLGRQSVGGETPSPVKSAEERRSEIDKIVSSLIDRQRDGTPSPIRRASRPSSVDAGHVPPLDGPELLQRRPQMQSVSTQTMTPDETLPSFSETVQAPAPSRPTREYITYTKGVQTDLYTDSWTDQQDDSEDQRSSRAKRRSSRSDEEIRAHLKKEIEEELRSTLNRDPTTTAMTGPQPRFPLRTLTSNELNAVTASSEFLSFVERSSKVLERALDEEYDLLADYTRTSALEDDDDDTTPHQGRTNKKSHALRESLQFFSDRHTRKRMVSDLHFSPHFNELVLSSYTKNPSAPHEPFGLVLLWNVHAPSRPEYVFTNGSDVLSARFSPFHPNLVIGGCYTGQICLWDTRISGRTGAPVQKTPQSGSHLGHTHPVYNLSVVGTPNAHNILTASTDGVVCSWSVDMLTQAQEHLVLHSPTPAKADYLGPTSMSFPASDPTFFLVGTEEGSIYPCHRYDRAGAKAGVDSRVAYRGHTAPVMSTQFHPARGPVDLGDLLLSSSSDWSVKLWRVKPAAGSSAAAAAAVSTSLSNGNAPQVISPVLDISREDLVYDAKWAPHKPSVFACVTGAGELEVFNLSYDLEVPIVTAAPSRGKNGIMPFKGLNKCAWEEKRGANIAVGGLDGVVTIFDVGKSLQCGSGEAPMEEWLGVKRMVSKLENATKV